MIDSHCHLDFPEFEGDIDGVLARASERGVSQLITIGCSLSRAEKAIAIAEGYEQVYATIAQHPEEISHDGEADADIVIPKLRELATSSKKIVGIGECGLDYHREEDRATAEQQKVLFRAHLDLARELGLPVSLHIRDAFEDGSEILSEYAGDIGGVVHCFTGDMFEMKHYLDEGWHIGLTGIVTFGDEQQEEIAREVPLDRFLVETDAPYIAPVPNRGKTCEPAFVVDTAQKIADLRGISLEEVDEATTQNVRDLFDIPSLM